MVFETKELGLEAVVEMVEKEFPAAIWAAGRCRCGAEEGDYAGTINSEDYGVVGLALTPNGPQPLVSGWAVHSHGKTPADALGLAYGKALGEGRG